jgi:hypothetical protein
MKEAPKRSILRWIHLVFSIPIFGYIYSPFDKIPNCAPATRYVFVPGAGPCGTLDVERPCRSTTYSKNSAYSDNNGTRMGGIKIHESIGTY